MLVRNVVAPPYPRVYYKTQLIEYVKEFKDLGVTIFAKLGWDYYINKSLGTIRNVHNTTQFVFRTIKKEMKLRRKIFFVYALPHFLWLFCIWFFSIHSQRDRIEYTFCSGFKILHNLRQWEDFTTLVLAREKFLTDYLYRYWRRLAHHLMHSDEGLSFQQC